MSQLNEPDIIMESIQDQGYVTGEDINRLLETLETGDMYDNKYKFVKSLLLHKLPDMLDYRNDSQQLHLQNLVNVFGNISQSDIFSKKFIDIVTSLNYIFGNKQIYNYDKSIRHIPLEWGLYLAGCFTPEDMTITVLPHRKEVVDLVRGLMNSQEENVFDISKTHSTTTILCPNADKISGLYDELCRYGQMGRLDKFSHKLNLFNLRDLMYATDTMLYEEYQMKDCIIRGYMLTYYNLIYDILDNILHESDTSMQINLMDKLLTKQNDIIQLYPCVLSHTVNMLLKIISVVLAKSRFYNKTEGVPVLPFNMDYLGENPDYIRCENVNDVVTTLCMIAESVKRLDCIDKTCLEHRSDTNREGNHRDPFVQHMTKPNTISNLDDIMEESCSLMRVLTETFEVLRDGTIKVTLKDDSSFMNEYAVNHRLLKYNAEQKNYDDMKYNLVYCMFLIENIEKNVMYNKKVSRDSDLYRDAEKARGFAKNDIKTYLPLLVQNDKSFSLNEFYRKVKADKATITINGVDTASGIKKILKSILYS